LICYWIGISTAVAEQIRSTRGSDFLWSNFQQYDRSFHYFDPARARLTTSPSDHPPRCGRPPQSLGVWPCCANRGETHLQEHDKDKEQWAIPAESLLSSPTKVPPFLPNIGIRRVSDSSGSRGLTRMTCSKSRPLPPAPSCWQRSFRQSQNCRAQGHRFDVCAQIHQKR